MTPRCWRPNLASFCTPEIAQSSRGQEVLKANPAHRRHRRYISPSGSHVGIRRCLASDTHTNMRILSVILLAVVLFLGVVAARPNEVLDFETDNVSHEQHGVPGQAVYGEYEAKDAHGNWYEVKYVADHHGFRTL
ncbi:uncharacterized protein LOC135112767 [Scylla paramamosain]|uniref:uncharacterized protein LOC135112767 n=1 Tax=Scylla paramamosain TaxID=85552 RepID=UPI00308394D9